MDLAIAWRYTGHGVFVASFGNIPAMVHLLVASDNLALNWPLAYSHDK